MSLSPIKLFFRLVITTQKVGTNEEKKKIEKLRPLGQMCPQSFVFSFLNFYLVGMGCGSVVSNSLVERLRDEPPARPKTPLSLEVEEL